MNCLLGIKRWLTNATNQVIPPKCANCKVGGALICQRCEEKIEWICGRTCTFCGKPVFSNTICRHCDLERPVVDRIRSTAFFVPPVVELIHQLKYYDQFGLKGPIGDMMVKRWHDHFGEQAFDLILPIPLARKRLKLRGFNQAALIAKEIGTGVGIPVAEDTLFRSRETRPQARLSKTERAKNVQGAFEVKPLPHKIKSVMLIDDVCTTGATLNAAGKVLKEAGVEFVAAYTFARPY